MSGIRKNWNEEDTLIALSLYYQITFGRISSKEMSLAELLMT